MPRPPHDIGRFLTLEQVADELGMSVAGTYRLVRRGAIIGIQIGSRGVWRVERHHLDDFLSRRAAGGTRPGVTAQG